MRWLVAFAILSSCQRSNVVDAHAIAKAGAKNGEEACYRISDSEGINGRYCLRYEGP